MKKLILLFVLFFSSFSFAGPIIIIIWPTSLSKEVIHLYDLSGEWVAYSHNTIWFIEFHNLPRNTQDIAVNITSNAVRTHRAAGILSANNNTLIGEIITSDGKAHAALLFRDHEGTKLRIASSSQKYYDLKLYPRQ